MRTWILGLGLLVATAGTPALACDGEEGSEEANRRPVLAQFDQDGDGQLNPQEHAAARQAYRDRMVKRHDLNGDGKITGPERPHDRDNNPPGCKGGPGTNWENPPGAAGGFGASPDRRSVDRDNNPPGLAGGAGTNWENRPGRCGGPGASPNRRRCR